MFFYRIASANEALVITGSKSKQSQFKIITGTGAFVFPVFSKTHRLSLDIREADLNEPCVTSQGIQLKVQAVAVFKVGDDDANISNAARRFLDQQDQMKPLVGQVLAGHLRSIVGGMTVEQIIKDRNALAQQVRDSSTDEMSKMGLVIDSFQIREIDDCGSEYIANMAKPHIAQIESDARIAAAQKNQAATEQEQLAAAANAGFNRDSAIAQAKATGEAEAASSEAAQRGPLAAAQAAQAVAEANADLAKKKALVTEADLESTVRRPADAQQYATVTTAEGEAQATKKRADAAQYQKVKEAEGDGSAAKARAEGERDATKARAEGAEAQAMSIRTVGEAEAAATKVKAEALNGANLQNQVGVTLAENMPAIVAAVADGLKGSKLTILNGSDGVGEIVTGVLGQGMEIYRTLVTGMSDATAGLKDGASAAPELAGRLDEMAGKGNK